MQEQPLNILIVDDDDVDRQAIRRALKQPGMKICFTEAVDAAGAIAILQTQTFDCIFVDYQLPDQNGLALIESINKLNVNSPIVVLTGQGDEQVAIKMMKSGATDYLPKTLISSKTLPLILRNAIRVYQSIMEAISANQRLHESHAHLARKNQELRLLERQQQDFIAHLTHDLKTPIVAADLMLKLFDREVFCPISPDMHTAIVAMIRSNKNLLDIVNTLLEVHCYESGNKEFTLITCNLWEISQDVVTELQPLADDKGITLKLRAIAEIAHDPNKLIVNGDYLELRRMLTNLIGNSIKFTDTGSVELRLGLSLVSSKEDINNFVTIEVEDTGVGMSEIEQDFLFQRFRKGSHKQSGSGLGLHLVHRIVTAHQGTIAVTSKLGKGSLFTIHLPIS